jgi:hypothetical protein
MYTKVGSAFLTQQILLLSRETRECLSDDSMSIELKPSLVRQRSASLETRATKL